LKSNELKRYTKQQEAAKAVLRDVDPEIVRGLKELSIEPLAMLEKGDIEGAVKHIKWLNLDNEEMQLFWVLFDSTQRRLMKEYEKEN